MAVYQEGDLIRVTGTFANAAGAATDPGTVTAYYRNPAGSVTTYVYGTDAEVVKSSTGIYYVDISADSPGYYLYGFRGTGSGQGAAEYSFRVDASSFF